MFTLIMRDHHTHPHKWDQQGNSGWDNFFGALLMAAALFLSIYLAGFSR